MDMGRVDDAFAGDGGQPISRQRARERVVGQDHDPEPRIAAFLRRLGDRLVADLLRDRVLVGNLYVAEGVQRGPVLGVEVLRDQQRPGALAKRGFARGHEEIGINHGVTRTVPLACGLPLLVEDPPETLAPEMEEREDHQKRLRAPVGHDATIHREQKRQAWSELHRSVRQFPRLQHVEEHQQEKRLVRGRLLPRPVYLQPADLAVPLLHDANRQAHRPWPRRGSKPSRDHNIASETRPTPRKHRGREALSIVNATVSGYGLLNETATIGTREGWQRRLAERGFTVRGHRLVRRRGEKGEEVEPRNYYPGTEEAHTNPTRQRGE